MERPPEPHLPHPPPDQLTRSREVRMVAGVCGGLARRTEIDPVVYRVAFAVLGCFGAGLLLYGAAWLLLPGEYAGASPAQRAFHRRIDGPAVLAVCLALLTGAIVALPPRNGPAVLALTVVLAVAGLTAHRRGVDLLGGILSLPRRLRFGRAIADEPASPSQPETRHLAGEAPATVPDTQAPFGPPPGYAPYPGTPGGAGPDSGHWHYVPTGDEVDLSLFGGTPVGDIDASAFELDSSGRRNGAWLSMVTLSMALLVAAATSGLGAMGVIPLTPQLVLAAVTVAIGTGLLAGTWFGNGRPLIVAGLLCSLLLAGSAAVPRIDLPLSGEVGDRSWVPHQQVRHPFELTAGDAQLDLTMLPDGQDYTFTAEVTVGELHVRVPEEAEVVIHAQSRMGSVVVDGRQTRAGYDAEFTKRFAGSGRGQRTTIELHLRNGMGEVRVDRVKP